MITTRWLDNKIESIEEAIELLSVAPNNYINQDSPSYYNWDVQKVFEEIQEVTLNGKEIKYNYFKYKYDYITPGNQPIEDRTVKNEGIIIAYFNGKSVNYIINRNSDAQKILRKLLNYTGRNEIEKNMVSFDNVFFIWLINRVYTNENIIEPFNDELHSISLDAIKGFKGNTEDLLTKVTANGESVMNIISTLSFLLESRNLHQITLDLQYFTHQSITLVLSNKSNDANNGTVSIYENKYQGTLEDEANQDNVLPKLFLLVYLEILPILIQSYNSDKDNERWSESANITFLESVAEELSDKVAIRVDSLKTNRN